MSSPNASLVELASAALAQRPLDPSKFPEGNCVAGNPFFGDEGNGAALFPEFMSALAMHGAGDVAANRITAILEAVDEAANASEFIIIARTKKKVTDLNAGELEFLVSYLKIARNMRARVDEVERAPAAPRPPERTPLKAAVNVVADLVDADLMPIMAAPAAASPSEKNDPNKPASVFTAPPITMDEAKKRQGGHAHGGGSHSPDKAGGHAKTWKEQMAMWAGPAVLVLAIAAAVKLLSL